MSLTWHDAFKNHVCFHKWKNFLLSRSWITYDCVYKFVFIHSCFEGHTFVSWLLWKKLQCSWECRYIFRILFSLPLNIYQEVVFFSMLDGSSIFKEFPFCSPSWLYQLIIPSMLCKDFLFFTSSSTFCSLHDDSHSNRCAVISHCGSDWLSLKIFHYIFM